MMTSRIRRDATMRGAAAAVAAALLLLGGGGASPATAAGGRAGATAAAVQDSEAAASSKLAGIALPAGAERILAAKAARDAADALGAITAELQPPARVAATEVLGWGGPGYARAKGRAVVSQVRGALTKAGFEVRALGEPKQAEGNTITFFVAGSEKAKTAIVGYWLESDTLLVLAWGRLAGGAAAAAPAAAAPARVAPTPGPSFPWLSAKPNEATGAVRDAAGKPLAGARIRFWRLTPQGAIIEYTARTDADGVYSLALPPPPAGTDYRIDNATALVRYGQQQYYLPLRPAGGDGTFFDGVPVDARKGYVKNFVLPISGLVSPEEDPKEPLSYYGGTIVFRANLVVEVPGDPALSAGATRPGAVPEGTRVALTLTPRGPLLDGTAGRPLRFDLTVRNNARINAFEATLKDVPIGVYTAEARVTTPDGRTYAPPLSARIVTARGVGATFTTDAENPIFFAPRWDDWPMQNGNVDAAPLIKRSSKGGAGAVWLEIGG